MNDRTLRIGMIGLDTSHAPAFAELLNDPSHPHHIPGAQVTAAYPGGSSDFELSRSRVAGFAARLRDGFGVDIAATIEEVAERCDAVMLLSVDGRVHLEQFKRAAAYGKPVFVDKPFAVGSGDAEAMASIAAERGIPLMSCSSVRYAQGLSDAIAEEAQGAIIGADCCGPMELQPTQPGLFWYGIHTADMLYAAMGRGCREVKAFTNDDHDEIVGVWEDGRIGTIRGNRKGNRNFCALIHREQSSRFVDVYAHPKPYYASMLEAIVAMFRTGAAPIEMKETLEVIRFIEAANESRRTGAAVRLS
ncbi:Oxidoreductase family, NAD-binding Rossmann fold [Paenibacillus konkukensis]|uniref:Oxidoreductase family, NAD-binding Rossmann fold n=1 Tax=Paenibacillus konkukensis TaxID=2020716 RepID=A0ABY4RVR3_9BACL|nr:Gfo/Idh/MocA family oxidoreductase [Paenibacillus konkukensis]UQZ86328.1 Oxidoreductase family, NAD-binding Rossmann fold [Paenibacillus konkukensis]